MTKLHKTSALLTLLTITPMLAVASISHAVALAQLDSAAVAVGKELGDKSMATWFVALGVIAIGSWFYVFKLTIGQLDQQRAANADLVKQIISGHEADNHDLKELLREAVTAIKAFSNSLKQ